ncbi:dual oxidase maturation factor 1-like [Diadema antillarum]|uniref:dual oxidase maturation factor 1-like n=1 Tax=Diadema antillarum TaxID=105358 RepID=UPI003A8AF8EE
MAYGAFRNGGFPTYYPPNQTAVTADVLVVGFIFAFLISSFSVFIILPGIRGWKRVFAALRIIISFFVGSSIIISNYGQDWEVSAIHNATTAYRAWKAGEIHADIGVKIGLRSVNITLKGVPEYQDGDSPAAGERVNYNERFEFNGPQGRNGFGRYAGKVNQEFRDAQYRGLPYPILWIAEYFTLDGELIRWGRSYRLAGYYTSIIVWLSFPLWLMANIVLMCGVISTGLWLLFFTGSCLLGGNVLYATIRYGSTLSIPFSSDHVLTFSFGWSFYLCLTGGLLAAIASSLGLLFDCLYPAETSIFFGNDEDFEAKVEYYHAESKRAVLLSRQRWVSSLQRVILRRSREVTPVTLASKRRFTIQNIKLDNSELLEDLEPTAMHI